MIRSMILLAASLAVIPPAVHGGPFDPIARVNGQVITQFELDQRVLFLTAMNIPGDLERDALDRLIDERLQSDAAQRAGIDVSEGDVQVGMEEFASRTDMNATQFVEALGRTGISRESFADFVRVGLAWRRLVRGLFSARAQVSESEVDRAVSLGSFGSGARVLLSEIFLNADTPERRASARGLAEDIGEYRTVAEFAEAARRYSVAPSARQGGRQGWVPVDQLPEAYRNQILALSPGQVTEPISLPNAIAVFQLHEIEETGRSEEVPVSIEYARYLIPGGASDEALRQAREAEAKTDNCDDLYGIAAGLPEDHLQRNAVPISDVPSDIAAELEQLDEGEVSARLVSDDGEMLVLLMLCGRTFAATEDVDREILRQGLFSQRLASHAESYLADLRAQAVIELK